MFLDLFCLALTKICITGVSLCRDIICSILNTQSLSSCKHKTALWHGDKGENEELRQEAFTLVLLLPDVLEEGCFLMDFSLFTH